MQYGKKTVTAIVFCIFLLTGSQGFACELIGYSFDKQISANHLFSTFRAHSKKNPDGWGAGYYSGKSVVLFKDELSAEKSALAEFLSGYNGLNADIFISHVRRTSVGSIGYSNTHPFVRSLNGRDYLFAHNGTLKDFPAGLPLSGLMPVGETDSEHLFCYILGRMNDTGIKSLDETSFKWLHRLIRDANRTGILNGLFSDGERLFVYHDLSGYNPVHYLQRAVPTDTGTASGIVIVTKPLTSEKWIPFEPGELRVFSRGRCVYP